MLCYLPETAGLYHSYVMPLYLTHSCRPIVIVIAVSSTKGFTEELTELRSGLKSKDQHDTGCVVQ